MTLRAEVRDKSFKPSTDATVSSTVSDGHGPADDARDDARSPASAALYEADLRDDAHRHLPLRGRPRSPATKSSASARFAVRREDGVVEHYRMQQNRPLLERLAAATGGTYFASTTSSRLPEAVSFSDAGSVERTVLDLWNMPIVFFCCCC